MGKEMSTELHSVRLFQAAVTRGLWCVAVKYRNICGMLKEAEASHKLCLSGLGLRSTVFLPIARALRGQTQLQQLHLPGNLPLSAAAAALCLCLIRMFLFCASVQVFKANFFTK